MMGDLSQVASLIYYSATHTYPFEPGHRLSGILRPLSAWMDPREPLTVKLLPLPEGDPVVRMFEEQYA